MQYVKIKDAIVEQIDAGMLMPRQKLPAERKLAESFDTTRVTLREALSCSKLKGRFTVKIAAVGLFRPRLYAMTPLKRSTLPIWRWRKIASRKRSWCLPKR